LMEALRRKGKITFLEDLSGISQYSNPQKKKAENLFTFQTFSCFTHHYMALRVEERDRGDRERGFDEVMTCVL
jgi:hypothetical protein